MELEDVKVSYGNLNDGKLTKNANIFDGALEQKIFKEFFNKYRTIKPEILQKPKKDRSPEEVLWLRIYKKYDSFYTRKENLLNEVRRKFLSYFKIYPLNRIMFLCRNDKNETIKVTTYQETIPKETKTMIVLYRNEPIIAVKRDFDRITFDSKILPTDRKEVKKVKKEFTRTMYIRTLNPKVDWIV